MFAVNCHSRRFDFMLPYGGEPVDVRDEEIGIFDNREDAVDTIITIIRKQTGESERAMSVLKRAQNRLKRDNSWEYFYKGRLYTFVITDKSVEPADDKLKERIMEKDGMER